MIKLIGLALLAASMTASFAAQNPFNQTPPPSRRPVRIPVRSADPWFIKFALEGRPLVSPELSTIFNLFGAGGPAGNQAANNVNSLLSGGKLLVNPTDNSLWWYPD